MTNSGSIRFGSAALVLALCLPAAAQNLSTLLQTDIHGQYFAIKKVMQGFYDRGTLRSGIEPGNEPYDLYICDTGSEYTGDPDSSPKLVSALSTLALQIVVWRNDLRKLAYPESLWRPLLVDYEDKQLSLYGAANAMTGAVSDRSFEQYKSVVTSLEKNLSAYRAQSNPALRPVKQEGGCGAGEMKVRVKIDPPNGRVFFIPVFFYELCKAQQINPDDVDRCDQWREALNGSLTAVAGDYRYSASWPGGITRRAVLSFDHNQMDPVAVIRKPQQ